MTGWPVFVDEHGIQVTDDTGAVYPVLMNNYPVLGLNPGWTAQKLYSSPVLPLLVLELVHTETDTRAFWYLDHNLNFKGNDLAGSLEEGLRSQMLGNLTSLRSLLLDPLPVINTSLCQLTDLPAAFLKEYVTGWLDASFPAMVQCPLNEATDRPLPGHSGKQISAKQVEHLLTLLPHNIPAELTHFIVPSPVDGHPTQAQDMLPLGLGTCYRFVDTVHDVVFFLACTHRGVPDVFFCPAASLLVHDPAIEKPLNFPLSLVLWHLHHPDHAVPPPRVVVIEDLGLGQTSRLSFMDSEPAALPLPDTNIFQPPVVQRRQQEEEAEPAPQPEQDHAAAPPAAQEDSDQSPKTWLHRIRIRKRNIPV